MKMITNLVFSARLPGVPLKIAVVAHTDGWHVIRDATDRSWSRRCFSEGEGAMWHLRRSGRSVRGGTQHDAGRYARLTTGPCTK